MLKLTTLICLVLMPGLIACSSQDLKAFGKDIAHNVQCDRQYEYMHKADSLKDDCLNHRP